MDNKTQAVIFAAAATACPDEKQATIYKAKGEALIQAANPFGCNQYGEGWKKPHNGVQSWRAKKDTKDKEKDKTKEEKDKEKKEKDKKKESELEMRRGLLYGKK